MGGPSGQKTSKQVLGSPGDLELRLPRNSPFVGSLRHAPQGEVPAGPACSMVGWGGVFFGVGSGRSL